MRTSRRWLHSLPKSMPSCVRSILRRRRHRDFGELQPSPQPLSLRGFLGTPSKPRGFLPLSRNALRERGFSPLPPEGEGVGGDEGKLAGLLTLNTSSWGDVVRFWARRPDFSPTCVKP